MHSRLAKSLVELGLPIERTAKSWRIAGMTDAMDAKFSRRTKQINALAERLGITDPAQKAQALGALSRDRKNKQLSFDELRTLWMSWLTPDESSILSRIEQGAILPFVPKFDEQVANHAIEYATDHHLERESVTPTRTLLTTALHHSIGESSPEQILSAIQNTDLIHAESEGRAMVTTPTVLAEEQRMIQFARDGRGNSESLSPDDVLPMRDWLNQGQRKTLEHICTSRDQIILVRGVAGSGKTSMLKEAVEKIEKQGKKVFVFAPSAQASRDVLRQEGFSNAQTVAFLLNSAHAQAEVKENVILVDEAGLLGTRTMAKLFDLAEKSNARVILVGDRHQHKSVERGSALKLLEEEAGIRSGPTY